MPDLISLIKKIKNNLLPGLSILIILTLLILGSRRPPDRPRLPTVVKDGEYGQFLFAAARLPMAGGDENNWGEILNEFLRVSHEENGELKPSGLGDITGLGIVNVKEFGAKGDGTTDDTSAIQAAINYRGSDGGMVYLPPGVYRVTSSLVFFNNNHMKFAGAGKNLTNILWDGGAAGPVLDVGSVRDSFFEGFRIAVQGVNLNLAIKIHNASGATVSTNNVFKDIYIHPTAWAIGNGSITDGVKIGDGTDANNDFHKFIRVSMGDILRDGFVIENSSQAKHILFEDSHVGSLRYGLRQDGGGSFKWVRGGMRGQTTANFHLGQPTDVIMIDGIDVERSAAFMDSSDAASDWATIVQNVRWDSPSEANASGKVIEFNFSGPLVLIGNRFQSGTTDLIVTGNTSTSLVAIGNYVKNTATTKFWSGSWKSIVALGNLVGTPYTYQNADASFGANLSVSEGSNFIVPSGKIGIGTSNPQTPLHIVSNAGTKLALDHPTADSGQEISFRVNGVDRGLIQWFNGAFRLHPDITVLDPTSPPFVVNSSGNVGIGITSPTSKLHVVGKATITGGIDPPYVSFSDETRESIIKRAENIEEHEKVMMFWNSQTKSMEVYNIQEGAFYSIGGEKLD